MRKHLIMSNCSHCERPFLKNAERNSQRYCSIECRLWANVQKTDGCWLWTGAKTKNGYGLMNIDKTYYLTHRVSVAIAHRHLSDHDDVCHKCDNPACVNPDHLFVANHAGNMRDMAVKLRHGRRKLTPEQVREIRESRLSGTFKATELAARFNVSEATIYSTLRGRVHDHIN